MQFIKLQTSDNDARYINLEHVSRVTLATDATRGAPRLAIFFGDARHESKLEIVGSNDQDRKAIDGFIAAMESVCTK